MSIEKSRMTEKYIRYEDAIKVIDQFRCTRISCKRCIESGDANSCFTIVAKRELKKLAVKAAPVRHGHWIPVDPDERGYTTIFECSNCHCENELECFMTADLDDDFCPRCGAKIEAFG